MIFYELISYFIPELGLYVQNKEVSTNHLRLLHGHVSTLWLKIGNEFKGDEFVKYCIEAIKALYNE